MKMRKIWLIMFQKSSHIEIEFLKKILVSFLWHLFLNLEKSILLTSWYWLQFFNNGDKIQLCQQQFFLPSPTSMLLDSTSDCRNASVIKMKLFTKNEANVSSENRKSFQSCKCSFIWNSFGFKFKPLLKIQR